MEDSMDSLYLTQLYHEARKNTGWIKFMGILLIVVGIPGALFLVGLLYIWLGMMLVQAANSVERGGEAGLLVYIEKLGTYFKVYAIITIVSLILSLAFVAIALFIGLNSLHDAGIFT